MLKLEDIHSYYGTSHVLQGVSLEVGRNEVVTLLGRNGAGKTTTLKTTMGLVPLRQGRISFKDRSLGGLKPYQISRRRIAYVPEERAIFTHLSVVENLEIAQVGFKGKLKGDWTVKRVFEIFPRLGERRKHSGANLSGGEQQMLAIARALMSEPELLLLDEPSEGLAPLIVKELEKVLRGIAGEGIAILLVEQNLDLCLALAHRHYIIDQGRLVYQGDSQDFKENREVKDRYLTLSSVDTDLLSD